MSKVIIYTIVLTCCCIQLNAQKNINLIISIDDNIPTGSLSGLKLVAVNENGSKETISADYYPGNLSLSEFDYKNLLDTSIRTVYLIFNYTEYQNQKQYSYNYDIDLKKGWLQHYYYVLNIYNTTKKKYKNLFSVPVGKEYV